MLAHMRTGMGLAALVAAAVTMAPSQEAWALIEGGVGNAPVRDPGWPAGAAAIFNVPSRIAWWSGPPFGGGQWHAECRGDVRALNAVLADFAKLDVKTKRIVLHDGNGRSFWLNPNNEPAKRDAARMDWSFMVWQPDVWEKLRQLPPDLNPTSPEEAESGPPSQIDIYTGSIKWADVVVPMGLKVVDQRLEAHGFTAADGVVLEGKVINLENQKPVPAALARLELIEPQQKGGYKYTTAAKTIADAEGRWVLKQVPAGWYRVIIEAPGFIARVAGHLKPDGQPRWHAYDTGLARAGIVAGRVVDDAGKPLADVEVRLANVATTAGARYSPAHGGTIKTDAEGRFRSEQVPIGRTTIWLHKAGYCRPGLGLSITTPKEDVELTMTRAARVVVTVEFNGKQRPREYLVSIEPAGGEAVGQYGGSGRINDKDQTTFENVPPGRYVLHGHPNPTNDNQRTDPIAVNLEGGKTAEVKLTAR